GDEPTPDRRRRRRLGDGGDGDGEDGAEHHRRRSSGGVTGPRTAVTDLATTTAGHASNDGGSLDFDGDGSLDFDGDGVGTTMLADDGGTSTSLMCREGSFRMPSCMAEFPGLWVDQLIFFFSIKPVSQASWAF
ncbi:hypothetical protein LINPERPRIM_LOCUS2104, partial [Linum perenne]